MTNTNETMNTTVNTEMAEVANEAVKMAKLPEGMVPRKNDMIMLGKVGIGVALAGAAIYGGKKLWDKKIAPKFKKNKKEETKTEE